MLAEFNSVETFYYGTGSRLKMKPYNPYSLIFRQRVEREIPRLFAAFVVFPA